MTKRSEIGEFAGHVHSREGAHDRTHPRVILLKLPDPYLRGFMHASPDAVGMQSLRMLRVLVRGVVGSEP